MNYRFRAPAEASWLALGAAAGTLAGVVSASLGAEAELASAIGAFTAVAFRFVAGFFIPEPSDG